MPADVNYIARSLATSASVSGYPGVMRAGLFEAGAEKQGPVAFFRSLTLARTVEAALNRTA